MIKNKKITVIIPSAGVGRRMKSYGPKCLIELSHEHTILDRQIEIIKSTFPSPEIIIVCGFESDKVISKAPEECMKLENELHEVTNVARSVGMALRATKASEVIIINGDLVFNKIALTSLDYSTSCTSANKDERMDGEVGCIVDENDNVANMMYDLDLKWNQIIYLTGTELSLFKKEVWRTKHKKYFLFEILNKVISKGGKIKCIRDDGVRLVDVDSSRDISRAKEII
tara:strand:- start:22211 stop:22894 length:684 start_codon:yes stop_codon:yes gene_type:complete